MKNKKKEKGKNLLGVNEGAERTGDLQATSAASCKKYPGCRRSGLKMLKNLRRKSELLFSRGRRKARLKLPRNVSARVCLGRGLSQLVESRAGPPQQRPRKPAGLMMFLVVLMGTIKGSTCLSIN